MATDKVESLNINVPIFTSSKDDIERIKNDIECIRNIDIPTDELDELFLSVFTSHSCIPVLTIFLDI